MAENIIAYCKCSSIFRRFLKRLKRKKMRDLSALRQISHAITMQQTVSPVCNKTFSFPARPVSFLKICKSGNWHTSLLSLYTCIYFSTRPRKYSIQLNYTYEYIVGVRKSGKKKKKKGGGSRAIEAKEKYGGWSSTLRRSITPRSSEFLPSVKCN